MTDSSEIGRFGTLRLLNKRDSNTTIAFFPVDEEEVTFGRGYKCDIRLYYVFVSEVHCILRISEDRKAFLVVKGANGVVIDGCEVKPKPHQTQDPIVPITNGSEIVVHTRTFKFEYPPKEIRAALLATPRSSGTRRRSLRMSMIPSAHVLSPRKVLPSSPLKPSVRTPTKNSSLSRLMCQEKDDKQDVDIWDILKTPVKAPFPSEEPEMLLIQGSGEDAVVVEEEKDLIILEHVDEPPELMPVSLMNHTMTTTTAAPTSPVTAPQPERMPTKKTTNLSFPIIATSPTKPPALKTPLPNRRKSGISLHRAVVLRSAHRTHWEQERQRSLEQIQDEEEEEEVEFAVSPERDLGPFELSVQDDDDDEVGKEIPNAGTNSEKVQTESDGSEDQDEESFEGDGTQLSPSISRPYSSAPRAAQAKLNVAKNLASEKPSERVLPRVNETLKYRAPSPVRHTLPNFMTPQTATFKSKFTQRAPVEALKPRQTLSGGENFPFFGGARRVLVPSMSVEESVDWKDSLKQVQSTAKPRITSEEREAILERRRSALLTQTSILPPPGPRTGNLNATLGKEDEYVPGNDDTEDSQTMLEKMKVKLENARRRSEARKARFSYASPHPKGISLDHNMDQTSASPAMKSRTLSMAEESLRRMKLEDYEDKTGADLTSISHPENSSQRSTAVPQTPSFRGIRELFKNNRSWMNSSQTPSFVGLRDMYAIPTTTVTPDMRLDEIFTSVDEDSEEENELATSIEEHISTKPSPHISAGKPVSRIPSSRGVKRQVFERTSPEVPFQPAPTHQLKRVTRKAAVEPLAEVQNNQHGGVNYDEGPTDSSGHGNTVSVRRVTRSRNAKVAAEEENVDVPAANNRRATRQTKKQLADPIEGKSEKTRRGAQTTKPVMQIKQEDEMTAPKSTQRRKNRVK